MTEKKPAYYIDVKFSVPWGYISGKLWGNAKSQPVLVLHGLLDNCGAFDRLIPQLNGADYHILAIDLPGHGLSSHFPVGIPIDFLYFIIATKYVIDEIQWRRFFIIGHSLGGLISVFFTGCYPSLVSKLVIIDTICTKILDDTDLINPYRIWINDFIKMNERLQKCSQPVYSYEEALNKLINRDSYVTSEAAKILTKRSLEKTKQGYIFRMDQRLKLDLFPSMSTPVIKYAFSNLRCPILIIYSTERYEPYKNIFSDIFEVISKKTNIKVDVVDGNHEVHQNTPEKLVKLIDGFFNSENCKL